MGALARNGLRLIFKGYQKPRNSIKLRLGRFYGT